MCKERPILFNADMVRAILDGRKTQTRRAIKLKTGDTFDEHALKGAIQEWRPMYDEVAQKVVGKTAALIRCPYGQPGDRLWVRETHAIVPRTSYAQSEDVDQRLRPDDKHDAAIYRAGWKRSTGGFKWRPSIHMPRWASRITLEIVSVHVERLQDISEADAQAEGFKCVSKDGELFKWGLPDEDGLPGTDDFGWPWVDWKHNPRNAFAQLWDQINGELAWNANPWVWVVEFSRVEVSQ